MPDFCMAIIVSLRLTLSSPITKAFCRASDFSCDCATPSSAFFNTLEKSTLPDEAAGADSRNPAAAAATRIFASNPSTADILLIFPPFLISQPPLPAAHFTQQNTPPKSPTHVAYNRLLQ
jgi:hypothetical protein